MMFSKKAKHTCTWRGEEVGRQQPHFGALQALMAQYIHGKSKICQGQIIKRIIDKYTTWMENDVFKESETYMYLAGGGKRWVSNNFALVLFKNHCHNRFLHKVTYVKAIQVKLFFQRKRNIIKSI